jgi:UDP-glucose 4-epimerase
MTVLISGGAGYIASHMTLALADKGEKVVVLDDLSTGFRSAVPSEVPLYIGDIADNALVTEVIHRHNVSEIAHFAARTVVPDSVRTPLAYYEANTVKTRALIETATSQGVKRFIFSSTAAVYGEPDVVDVDEDVAPAPINPYGRSKLMSEWMLRDAAAATGLRYAILRYFNVAGADPQMRTGQSTEQATHLIKVACQAALGLRSSVTIFGTDLPTADGTGVRDYIQVSDLADAHVCALTYLREAGTNLLLNCGYGRGYSVLEVLDAVKRVSGVDFPVILGSRRPGDPAALIARADHIRSLLDWRPRFENLDEIVSQAFAWERHEALRRRAAFNGDAAASAAQAGWESASLGSR